MRLKRILSICVAVLTLGWTPAASAQPTSPSARSAQDLKRLSLEDLLDIEVTTVSRVPELTSTVPAAVYVITQEDLRRSGARSIPEALRLVPGLQVAQMSGGTWAVGIRGFADRLARSILVLIDGRAVYSPLFAGTYWESQDTLLADIDRIEVIRGPGGTLWGANAVNGIVNIITKPARDTQGAYARVDAGTQLRAMGAFRYGGHTGSLDYRAYVKAADRGPEFHVSGPEYDGWRAAQGGFRADWTLSDRRRFTLQGDAYDGRLGERPTISSYTPPFTTTSELDAPISGANVLARLSSGPADGDSYQLQAYYDRTSRDEIPIGEKRDTGDVDFQYTLRRWRRQTVTWGAGYRITSGRITAIAPSGMTPQRRTDNLFTAFAQDDVVVVPQRWRVTFGSKIEHNAYSGFEVQPSVRALWTPSHAHTAWLAVTRAVRTPSRVETDYTTSRFAGGVPTFVRLIPNPEFTSERLVAYEAGYRMRPAPTVYLTASGFYNDLDDILGTDLLPSFFEDGPPRRLIIPVQFRNSLEGHSQGVELTADVRPAPWWRLTGNYSALFVSAARQAGSTDVSQERRYEGGSPKHQLLVGNSFDAGRWSFDWWTRHVSALRNPVVPAYTASDVRLAWLWNSHVDLSVVGRDLFAAHHLEWPSDGGNIEINRSVYASLTWRR